MPETIEKILAQEITGLVEGTTGQVAAQETTGVAPEAEGTTGIIITGITTAILRKGIRIMMELGICN